MSSRSWTGATGPREIGATGVSGATGPAGSAGGVSATGATGPTGVAGATDATGPSGRDAGFRYLWDTGTRMPIPARARSAVIAEPSARSRRSIFPRRTTTGPRRLPTWPSTSRGPLTPPARLYSSRQDLHQPPIADRVRLPGFQAIVDCMIEAGWRAGDSERG